MYLFICILSWYIKFYLVLTILKYVSPEASLNSDKIKHHPFLSLLQWYPLFFQIKHKPLLKLCHVESSGSGGTFGLRLFLHFPVKTEHTSPTMSDDAFPAEWLENSDIPYPEKKKPLTLAREIGGTRVWQQNSSSVCLVHSSIQTRLYEAVVQ